MIKSICRNYSWVSPPIIDGMFVDAKDHHGIIYWYNDIAAQHAEMEAKTKKK